MLLKQSFYEFPIEILKFFLSIINVQLQIIP